MKEFLTACPRNCYSTCSFRVFTEDGRVVRILPWEGNRATPEGPCIKGLSYLERESSSSRIIHPLKRNGDGTFIQITMDEALTTIADRLGAVRRDHGSHAVLFYKGSGMSGLSNDIASLFWKKYGGVTSLYGNLCWPAGLEAVRLTLGEVKHNAPWDLANAELIIMWGKNPAETNIQEILHVDKALKKGGKLIVIDPRRTPTADKADMILRPNPGTDAALALAIARCLVTEHRVDYDFIRSHVKGYDEFSESLDITTEEAEKITGVPAKAIKAVADLIASTSRVTVCAGYGVQRYSNGGQTIRAILSLMVITGKIGRSGCGFNYANLQSYVFDSEKEPLSYYPDEIKDKPFRRSISMARFGECISSLTSPAIEFAWIERGNPLTQLPGTTGVREALDKIPFKVVVEQFMTDTARLADIILPAKGIFDQPDIIGSYWNPYVQYKPAVTECPGEVMPESEIYYHLAELLHLPDEGYDAIPAPGNSNFDEWLGKRVKEYGLLSMEQIKEGPVLPPDFEEIAFESFNFRTPSGKIELLSDDAVRLWRVAVLPTYQPLNDNSDEPGTLHLLTPCTGSRIHSQFGNLEIIRSLVESPAYEISPEDAIRLSVADGQMIQLSNASGVTKGPVRISPRVKTGCIVFPNGIWNHEGGGVNALIPGRETDMGYGAAFHDNKVRIEKLES